MKKLTNVILFLYILSVFIFTNNPDFNYMTNIIAGIFVIITLAMNLKKRLAFFHGFSFGFIIITFFILFSLVSVTYAKYPEYSLLSVKSLSLNFLMMIAILINFESMEDIDYIIKCVAWSSFITTAYILFSSFNLIGIERLGSKLIGLNRFALFLSVGMIFLIYLLFSSRKYIYVFPLFITSILLLLTGSRNAIIFFLISIFVALFMANIRRLFKLLKNVFTASVIVAILSLIIIRIPIFYNIIGIRFESLISYIRYGEVIREKSILSRADMIEIGLKMFANSPIIGNGVNNFRGFWFLFSGKEQYAHSDFIEMLSGLGIIGFTLYYWIYIYMISMFFRHKTNNILAYILFGLLLAYLITSFTTVHYYVKYFWLFISIYFGYFIIVSRKFSPTHSVGTPA